MRASVLLLIGLATAPAAWADPSGSAASSPSTAQATVHADVRAEYLAGDPMVLTFEVRNDGASALKFPDISARPWLVGFSFKRADGATQQRRTTPPETDSGKLVTLQPRAQRRTVLEVPGSNSLPVGEHQLTIEIDAPSGKVALGPYTIRMADPAPVAGELGGATAGSEGQGVLAPWVHKAAQGFDLYLNEADSRNPRRTVADHYLAHLDKAVRPSLTAVRGADLWERHVVWLEGDRGIVYAQLDGPRLSAAPRQIDTPWPVVQMAGRGATDARGNLHIPLWVPAPKGKSGELRVLTVNGRGAPSFRRATSLSEPPTALQTHVDEAGTVHFLLLNQGHVDLYSMRPGDAEIAATQGLPLPGKRVIKAPADERLIDARFALLEESKAFAGGLAIVITGVGDTSATARWLTLSGRAIGASAPSPWPSGTRLLDVSPNSTGAPSLIARKADGSTVLSEGAEQVRLPALPTSEWALVRDAKGRLVLRELKTGGPIQSKLIEAP